MSGLRIGISVHEGELRGVAVRGRLVVWTHVEPIGDHPLDAACERIFRRMPRARFAAPRPRIVFGPRLAQQRRLLGLPASMHHRFIRAAVEENVERFFLRASARLIVTPPVACGDGTWTAAALDATAVAAISAAARAAGIVPECIAPASPVLVWALQPQDDRETFEWGEPDEQVRIHVLSGVVVAIQRVPRSASGDTVDTLQLRSELNGHERSFAEAYGAAIANLRSIPALRRRDLRQQSDAPARLLRLASCSTLALAVGTWLAAPAAFAARAASRAEVQMMARGREQRQFAHAAGESRRSAAAVALVESFRADRRSMLEILGAFTDALPESTAVTSFRVDSVGGTLTLLAPRVMDAIPALASVPALDGVHVVGPLLREVTGQKELERVTLHFRFRRGRTRPNELPATSRGPVLADKS
jgi:hypothetical protein